LGRPTKSAEALLSSCKYQEDYQSKDIKADSDPEYDVPALFLTGTTEDEACADVGENT
jgi:hypothetical protein